MSFRFFTFFFFFNDTATTEIYTLSLHDALPILNELRDGHPFLGARLQVPHHHLAGRPLVGTDDDRPGCSPRRGELQLLADGGGSEAVFDGDAPVAQLVRQVQQRRYVVAAHRYQKSVE